MVKTSIPSLPDWIERQASFGYKEGNIIPTKDNMFWQMLSNCCPLLFESYAIILHPFGINWKTKELIESGLSAKADFMGAEPMSWKDFFTYYNVPFSLETAYRSQVDLLSQLGTPRWPEYLFSPAEGIYGFDNLKLIIDGIISVHGDQSVDYYYNSMWTKRFDPDFF